MHSSYVALLLLAAAAAPALAAPVSAGTYLYAGPVPPSSPSVYGDATPVFGRDFDVANFLSEFDDQGRHMIRSLGSLIHEATHVLETGAETVEEEVLDARENGAAELTARRDVDHPIAHSSNPGAPVIKLPVSNPSQPAVEESLTQRLVTRDPSDHSHKLNQLLSRVHSAEIAARDILDLLNVNPAQETQTQNGGDGFEKPSQAFNSRNIISDIDNLLGGFLKGL